MKTIHKNIFFASLISLLLLISFSASAAQAPRGQRQADRSMDERKEAIEARRVSYITRHLSLSPAEAREFWPIYNSYTEKVQGLSETFRGQREEWPPVEEMSEEEAAAFVEAELKRFEDSAALRREYSQKLSEVISMHQVALLFEAERDFNRMLFREAQRRHRQERP